jgi:hypothetical protein
VVHGTARVLEKGEMIIGVLTPFGYGLHERLTVFTHPILDLLLTPNAWARLDVASREAWAIALEAGYQQVFLAEGWPGYAQAGLAASFVAGIAQFTTVLGYQARFGRDTDPARAYWRVGLDLLASARDLVMLRAADDLGIPPGGAAEDWIPTVWLVYAREFGRGALGAGLVAGRFRFADIPDWPVYPWIDFWWRF